MDAKQYDPGLELAPQDFPEVTRGQQGYGHQQQDFQQQPYQDPYQRQAYYQQQLYDIPATTSPKPEHPAPPPSTYGSQTATGSPYGSEAHPVFAAAAGPSKSAPLGRTICGVSLLVFVLSCIIALLSAAVIGLAAATGIESQRASDAAASLAAMISGSATSTAPAASSTATPVIDDGCSSNPSSVDKTLYTSFSLFGALKFTRYCNKDAPNTPLLSLFTADFDTCMDACAAYTKYVPGSFENTANATCAGVSFIPAWTSKTTATKGTAPGNCYLKGGPQNETGLNTPNIGVACHAAILTLG
ncbi:uncharacterized protein B0T15DRAFT_165450 [Chaetomium strumarium]|uniref:Uncharacterized protein n=1 Tax=Chaetomium strumarium TaxID=1170767 RepID=A0AAJ0GW07_9PEZI|nr:hypothetical protein B0T15DRAFT_165450 [Chaetomium strumarium]